MTPERWQQINEVFQAAVEVAPGQRTAFLDEACTTDETLRSEVESLLTSDEHEWELIEKPALEVAAPLLADDQPQLAPGQHIGHYEIVSLIDRGGMGEVYLAKDQRLNRRMALKLLPADYTRHKDRVQRFQQEAQAASALNHPNILTIYELVEVNDQQFIATEFVDGETLRHRMKRSGLGVAEALEITIQAASALAAAHQAGIVHRDIKPENIMIRPDGYVKVLDFGLAKLTEQHEPTPQARVADQLDISSGLVMGTVKYMSPEQARGLSVDARSDIFSLGVVLYEMVAGRTPFKGETAAGLIESILKDDPLSLAEFLSSAPEGLAHILSKALNKKKERRYETTNGFLIDLKGLKEELELESKLLSAVPSDSVSAAGSRARQTFITKGRGEQSSASVRHWSSTNSISEYLAGELAHHKIGALLVLLGLAIGAASFYGLMKWTARRGVSFQEMKITRLTNSGKVYHAAISRDGKNIVYKLYENGQSSLWVKHLPAGNDVQILAPAEVGYSDLTFSPDGNYVYYIQVDKTDSQSRLYQIPVAGGVATKLLVDIYRGVTFSPDGRRIAFTRVDEAQGESMLMLSNVDGTEEQKLAKRKLPDMYAYPAWSPDGNVIACVVVEMNGDNHGNHHNVAEVQVADGTEKLISSRWLRGMTQVAWLSDGKALLIAAKERTARPRQIWHLSYPGGEARRITNDTNDYNELSLTAGSSTIVAVQNENPFTMWIAPSEDARQVQQIALGANKGDGQFGFSWTPDGRIVYETDYDIWIMDANGSNRKQLTVAPQLDAAPVVTSDNRYVVFVSDRALSTNLWRMDIDGNNQKQLTYGPYDFDPQSSPDGQWVVYASVKAGKATLQKISVEGGNSVQLSEKVTRGPAISPDGKLIAGFYLDEKTNQWKVGVIPFSGGDPVKVFDTPATIDTEVPIRWTDDGRALTYSCSRVTISNVWSQPIDGGPPKQLTDFKSHHIDYFDWSRDGRHLALVRDTGSSDVVMISDFR
ncbi:MAG: protein kinase domain-containing protein [Pyrinomonadaceae bacterium]